VEDEKDEGHSKHSKAGGNSSTQKGESRHLPFASAGRRKAWSGSNRPEKGTDVKGEETGEAEAGTSEKEV